MALSALTVWEVRATGSDLNGGGFVPGGSGTDYSQQDAPALALADVVTNGTTTVTSATGGFTAAMVNNLVNVGGTPYWITSVGSSTSVTVDRAATAGSGQAGRVGGAMATLVPLAALANANTTYLRGVITTAGVALSGAANLIFEGYATTRGDGGQATLVANAANVTLFTGTGSAAFNNLAFDGANLSGSRGLSVNAFAAPQWSFRNCAFARFAGTAVAPGWVEFVDCRWANNAGRCVSADWASVGLIFDNCYFDSNAATLVDATGNPSRVVMVDTIAANATGGPLVAIPMGVSGHLVKRCTFRGSAVAPPSVGIFLSGGFTTNPGTVVVEANVFDTVTTGIDASASTTPRAALIRNNAFRAVTAQVSGASNVGRLVTGSITLAADPFTNAAGGDFSLNNAAGGGKLLRGAGIPGAFPGGTTIGFPDIGAVQSKSAGGAPSINGSPLIRVREVAA